MGVRHYQVGPFAALVLGACTFSITVPDPEIPDPAVDLIPATVAVLFSPEFRSFEHTGPSYRDAAGLDMSYGNAYHVELGDDNVSLFTQVFESMFSTVRFLDSRESAVESGEVFDAMFEVRVERFDAHFREAFGNSGFRVDLAYRITALDSAGDQLVDWELATYQEFGAGPSARRESIAAAMRSIGARFLLEFPQRPGIQEWLGRTSEQQVSSPLSADYGRAVVVLGTEQDVDDDDLQVCLGKALKRSRSRVNVIRAELFRDRLYPHFEPDTAPVNTTELSVLLSNTEVQERLQDLNVRFVLVAGGMTSFGEVGGGGLAGYGPGGGGALGVTWTDKATQLGVLIWDLEIPNDQVDFSVKAEGRNTMIWIGLPIPIIANTQRGACDEMTENVLAYLRDR